MVKEIASAAEYQGILNSAPPTKLIVVDFTAAWCGPCQTIKPVFERHSQTYKHVIFLKVDVDRHQDISSAAGVTAMPTFHFIKNKAKVAELKGANAGQLEALIKQHQGPVGEAGAAPLVAGHQDVGEYVTANQLDCLNQQLTNNVKNILTKEDTFLESDVDEQLIISIPFNESIRLHSLKIVPTENLDQAPKTIKVYVNRLALGFDEAEGGVVETQTIILSEKDYKENGGLVSLRFVKFQNVTSVILFVVDNLGDEETTQIKQIVFVGSPIGGTDMAALKKVEHDH